MGKMKTIDLQDHDTLHALNYLIQLVEANKVSGMVFALAIKNDRQHPHLCGATGRLAANSVEAAGISSMLHLKLTQDALDTSIKGEKG